MGTPDYKETVQDYALAISAWWSKLCHQRLHSNQTRQDYCSFITEHSLRLMKQLDKVQGEWG